MKRKTRRILCLQEATCATSGSNRGKKRRILKTVMATRG
jgi:hypothetical protein